MINQTVNNKESHSLSIHHTITKMRSSITALLTAQVPSDQPQPTAHRVENRDWRPHTSLKRCVSSIVFNLILAQYLKNLLVDKQENTQALIHTITQLYLKHVDPRQLALLKIAFVKNDRDGKGALQISQFKKVF